MNAPPPNDPTRFRNPNEPRALARAALRTQDNHAIAHSHVGWRALYPFESRFLSIDSVRMHYVDEGEGTPVLLLHGNPTWSFYYRELIKGLRNEFRVIAPDHIGCGLSDKPQSYPYTLKTHVENVSRLVEHLQLQEISLGMHDWGGAIGMGWAVRNLSRVRRLVVFNSAAFLGGPCPFRIRICRRSLLGDCVVRGLNLFVRASFRTACHRRERMTAETRQGYLYPYSSYADRVAILRFIRDIPLNLRDKSFETLSEIENALAKLSDRNILILWGMRDFCFNQWYLAEWARRFPKAEIHRFDDASHYVVEDAHERILPILRAFLGL